MPFKPALATLCAAAVAIAATPASAYEPQSNTVAKEKKTQEKKVCRWVEPTGSNRSERICLTAEEWRKVEEYLAKEF